MYPDEVSPEGWMRENGGGKGEKERWKRKGGSEEEGRTVGTFEWLVSG